MKKLSIRRIIQFGTLITILVLAILHQKFGIEKAAPIDAYCPFWAIESLLTFIFEWEFLKRIFTSSFILLGIFLVGTFFLGKVFCWYFCPLGLIQELLRKLWKKIGFKKDLELPEKIDKYLRLLKYIILILVAFFSYHIWDLVLRNNWPFSPLMHFWHEFNEKIIGYSVLLIMIVFALFAKSLWCRYLCPLGAFFGIFKKISFFGLVRDKKSCVWCGLCWVNCPAWLKVQKLEKVKSADCISCGKCINICFKNSLHYTIFGKKINKKTFDILVIVIVLIPLIITPFTPFWKTKPESNIITETWKINISNIRWSNTLEYVIQTTWVPFEIFSEKLWLSNNTDKHLKIKDIGNKYNIKGSNWILETDDFRIVIKDYLEDDSTNKILKEIEVPKKVKCPFEEVHCEFPWKCGRYIDKDHNNVCDLSE